MHQETDAELLERFRRMHPTFTAKTLQQVVCVKERMAFLLLKGFKMEEYQRKLLRLYIDLPANERQKHFPLQ